MLLTVCGRQFTLINVKPVWPAFYWLLIFSTFLFPCLNGQCKTIYSAFILMSVSTFVYLFTNKF